MMNPRSRASWRRGWFWPAWTRRGSPWVTACATGTSPSAGASANSSSIAMTLDENRKQEERQYAVFCERARVMEEAGTTSYWALASSLASLFSWSISPWVTACATGTSPSACWISRFP